ncbi:unnamed protein product [Adineta steineri]|uniref:G-protein coupled receptors family 1 profile domain-containing protein n=1 Tax=Adineta steineri TaxID=433720 RepID=A0A818QL82_9BILA|nr:unnamed protein product [Adineta steineri]CAF3642103.1 unnamed protein product [Adineta steineri]
MTTNTSEMQLNSVNIDLSVSMIVCILSVIISTIACLLIIILIIITRNLHSSTNLLVSSTCLSTLFYLVISTLNAFIFYTASVSTDWSCRIRGYLYYFSLSIVIYSYMIQAVSRLFWTVLYKHRYLLSMKCHIYLIIFKVSISFLLPLSTIITKDIVYRPFELCLVPMKHTFHIFYLLTIGFIIPIVIISIVYGIIYYYIVHATANFRQTLHGTKRDVKLARNILILLGIFLFGGFPTVLYIIVSNTVETAPSVLFLIAITTPSMAIAIEKIMTIVLNRDIRQVFKLRWIKWFSCCKTPTNRVQPITYTNNRIVNPTNTQKSQQNKTKTLNTRT